MTHWRPLAVSTEQPGPVLRAAQRRTVPANGVGFTPKALRQLVLVTVTM